jgi:DNA-binding MarR family transcriptional regulator
LQQDSSAGDAVDAIVAQWRRERPDLDPSAKHITGRIVRLASLFQHAFEQDKQSAFAEYGLKESDFGVLAPLRRAGEPFELTPTELARHRMITSGGMTAALDRLEQKGLIVRVPNPDDRRGSLVRLTADGRRVIDASMELHAEVEHKLVAPLDEDDARELQRILRQLLLAMESSA